MTTLFLAFRNPGPTWQRGMSSRQQSLWNEHADFMDALFDAGRIVLAGPYTDGSRVLIILNARNREEAEDMLRDDPWVGAGILLPSEVVEWTVFLDSRQKDRK